MKQRFMACVCMGIFGLLVAGCGSSGPTMAVEEGAPEQSVMVEMINEKGHKIGDAMLAQTAEGVNIKLSVSKLVPGKHGIHIHEKASCVKPDFQSAGAHFNPFAKEHGLENPKGPHAGDLPNLEVGSDGKAKTEFVAKFVTLQKNQPNSLLGPNGASLVIHEKADDNLSNPAGNSGARIACGEIK